MIAMRSFAFGLLAASIGVPALRRKSRTQPAQQQPLPGATASPWEGPMCWWNAASTECFSFEQYHPMRDVHPKNLCQSKASSQSKARCEVTLDTHGVPCTWNAEHWDPQQRCSAQTCEQAAGQEACASLSQSLLCAWEYDSCQPSDWKACNNTGPTDAATCEAATDSILPGFGREPYGRSVCQWESTDSGYTFCHKMSSCWNYQTKGACIQDAAKFGTCQWIEEVQHCQDTLECEDYKTEQMCAQDPANVAAKVGHGYAEAKCWWHTAALTVGPPLTAVWGEQVATSGNLEIYTNFDGKKNLYTIKDTNGMGHILGDLALNSLQVDRVLNGANEVVPWSDLPKPLPDGYMVHFATCRDNLPSITSTRVDGFCTASGSEAECRAAEKPACPEYCGRMSCWLSACKKGCQSCA